MKQVILFKTLSKAELQSLSTIVDETLPQAGSPAYQRSFNSISLWKIQRNKKRVAIRQYSL